MTRDELLIYNVTCFLAAEKLECDQDPAAFACAMAEDEDALRILTNAMVLLADSGERYVKNVQSFDGPRAMLLTIHDGGDGEPAEDS